MLVIYTSPGCASCRKAKQWLKDHRIDYTEKNIFSTILNEKEIKFLLERSENGTDDIISKRSKIIKESGVDIDSMSVNQLIRFIQDNESRSQKGVLRGLHYQKWPFAQSKLVRVISGAVLDVAVDIRKGSPTYGKHVSCLLTGENKRQFFIPRGFAHGFSVLSDEAVFQYKCDNFYHPESEGAIAWDAPELGIDWMLKPGEVILSEKDKDHPLLADTDSPFEYNIDLYQE